MMDVNEAAELYGCAKCGRMERLSDGRKQVRHTDGQYYHPACKPSEVCQKCFLTKPCECDDDS